MLIEFLSSNGSWIRFAITPEPLQVPSPPGRYCVSVSMHYSTRNDTLPEHHFVIEQNKIASALLFIAQRLGCARTQMMTHSGLSDNEVVIASRMRERHAAGHARTRMFYVAAFRSCVERLQQASAQQAQTVPAVLPSGPIVAVVNEPSSGPDNDADVPVEPQPSPRRPARPNVGDYRGQPTKTLMAAYYWRKTLDTH